MDHTRVGVSTLRWSPNGQWLATREYNGSDPLRIRVYAADTGTRLGPVVEVQRCSDFALSNRGDVIISNRSGEVYFRKYDDDKLQMLVTANLDSAAARVALTGDGTRAAVLLTNGLVRLLSTTDGHILTEWRPWFPYTLLQDPLPGGVVFINDSLLAVAYSNENAALRFIPLDSPKAKE